MKQILLLVMSIVYLSAETTIFYTELTDREFTEFNGQYNKKFRDIWSADSGVEMVSEDMVEHLRYRSREKKVSLDSSTVTFLKKYGFDSVFAVVPVLQDFSVETKRGRGFPGAVLGKAEGQLAVRYTFVDLMSGTTLYTGVAVSDTSIILGTTMTRPLNKSVNLSAHDRDKIISTLIDQNVRDSYRLLRIYKGELNRDSSKAGATK